MPYHPQPFANLNLNSANVSTTFSSTSENDLPWEDDTTFYYQPPFGLVSPSLPVEDYSRITTGTGIRPSPSAAPHQPGSDPGACRQCRRCSPQNPAFGNAPASGSRSEVHHGHSHSHSHHMRPSASAVEAPIHRPTPSRTPSRTPSQRSRHTTESS